jgi:hypothetical protein
VLLLQRMRYTKIALLTFGAGLVLGLVVVVIGIDPLDRIASGLMALGLFGIPVCMLIDWWPAAKTTQKSVKRRRTRAPAKRRAAVPRRPPRSRRPAPRKR